MLANPASLRLGLDRSGAALRHLGGLTAAENHLVFY